MCVITYTYGAFLIKNKKVRNFLRFYQSII